MLVARARDEIPCDVAADVPVRHFSLGGDVLPETPRLEVRFWGFVGAGVDGMVGCDRLRRRLLEWGHRTYLSRILLQIRVRESVGLMPQV